MTGSFHPEAEEFRPERSVHSLWIYPLKGGRGVEVEQLQVRRGLPEGDRRWMLVDDDGVFLSQRNLPALGQVGARLPPPDPTPEAPRVPGATPAPDVPRKTDGAPGLILDVAGESFRAALQEGAEPLEVSVWGDQVMGLPADPAADAWLSKRLRRRVRLVYVDDGELRTVDPRFASGHEVGFADGFPFLVIGTGSLAALNARLPGPLSMLRFRPNLVVEDPVPHAEDGWRRFAVGGVEFRGVKPCARCTVTTLDPATGEGGREPLRTLAHYRQWNGKLWFGMNAVATGAGRLEVGSRVEIREVSGAPFPEVLAETFPGSNM